VVLVARLLVVLWLTAHASSAGAQTFTTCDAANPYDDSPDEVALQQCLDRYDRVLLRAPKRPEYVGYLIADTVKIRRDGILFSSADAPARAILVAAPALIEPLLRATANAFELSFIRFDGNRDLREIRRKPCSEFRNFRNVELSGIGFRVRFVESMRAVCGSGMTVGNSSRFEIDNSWFYDNGLQPEDADGVPGLWSDGLNVFNCAGATIRDNAFWDNTDVDLGVNGGPGCSVYRNTIEHFAAYAFAGLVVGDPTRSGGEFSHNKITSAPDRLGFGLVVGCHPWFQCGGGYATAVSVHDNVVSGAVINLVVDGVNGGSVQNNVLRDAQGTRVMNCATSAAYTVNHAINVRLQTGYVIQPMDFRPACP
jgi:parallel beta helix pectate lyase-like protein